MLIFCTIYYTLSYMQIIPQIVKLIRTKSSNDYSLGMLLIQFISVTSWTIYIFTSNQKTLVNIGTIIDLLLIMLVDVFILKYYKFGEKKEVK